MSVSAESKSSALVWFADQRLLVMGHEDLIEEISGVAEKGKDSLADSDKFAQAQFESGASAIAYIDMDVLDGGDLKDVAKGYFNEVAPFASSLELDDAPHTNETVQVTDNGDGTHTAKFVVTKAWRYKLWVSGSCGCAP